MFSMRINKNFEVDKFQTACDLTQAMSESSSIKFGTPWFCGESLIHSLGIEKICYKSESSQGFHQ